MNYQNHYNLLISRGKSRLLEGYSEKHHIIPKCMGGDNSKENLVRLTAQEHFIAHQLLVKIYPGNISLHRAIFFMTKGIKTRYNIDINSKYYNILKTNYSTLLKKQYELYPWLVTPVNSKPKIANIWANMDTIFNFWELNNKPTASLLSSTLKIKISKSMIIWFIKSGNPVNCLEWIKWKNDKLVTSFDFTNIQFYTGPWRYHEFRNNLSQLKLWSIADKIYNLWILNDKCGYQNLCNLAKINKIDFNNSSMLFRGLIIWFIKNGSPKNNNNWNKWILSKEIPKIDIVQFDVPDKFSIFDHQNGLNKDNCNWKQKAGLKISKSLIGRTKETHEYIRRISENRRSLIDI